MQGLQLSSVELHRGMSFEDYEAIDAVNARRLSWIKRSPAYCKHQLENKSKKPSKELILGIRLHTAVLEPDRFAREYVFMDVETDLRTKEGKAAKEMFQFKNRGKTILKSTDYDQIAGMCEAINSHGIASSILDCPPEWREVVVTGVLPSGLKAKGRFDAYDPEKEILWDIKTTKDARNITFAKDIYTYGYYRSTAWYKALGEAAGLKIKHVALLAVEKTDNFGVNVFRLLDDLVNKGMGESLMLLTQYTGCTLSNQWPSYPERFHDIGVPVWAENLIQSEKVQNEEEEENYEFE